MRLCQWFLSFSLENVFKNIIGLHDRQLKTTLGIINPFWSKLQLIISSAASGDTCVWFTCEPLIVLIDSVGDKQSDVRLSVLGPWDDVKTPDGLRKFLHENIADGFGKQGFFTLDHPIVIRPTTSANWEHVLAVYNAAVHAAYTNIILDEPTP